jgi:hypothetical protein
MAGRPTAGASVHGGMNSANGVDVSVDANTPRRRSGDNLDGA